MWRLPPTAIVSQSPNDRRFTSMTVTTASYASTSGRKSALPIPRGSSARGCTRFTEEIMQSSGPSYNCFANLKVDSSYLSRFNHNPCSLGKTWRPCCDVIDDEHRSNMLLRTARNVPTKILIPVSSASSIYVSWSQIPIPSFNRRQ